MPSMTLAQSCSSSLGSTHRGMLWPQPASLHKPHAWAGCLWKHTGPFPSQALHSEYHVVSLTSQLFGQRPTSHHEARAQIPYRLMRWRMSRWSFTQAGPSILRIAGPARPEREQPMPEAGPRSVGTGDEELASARLSHIWRLPGHGLSSAGGGRAVMH